jgi:glycosyltransferase involved in cell wall biosynthesis
MIATPSLALVINTFDQPDYLERVLGAVARQSALPDEVLLADDGSGEETRRRFAAWAVTARCRQAHVWQTHEGFRRARILNQAIARARSDYLVFLDGDTVPHPRFVADHRELAAPGQFVQGHRALVKERAALWFAQGELLADRRRAWLGGGLSGWQNAFRWPVTLCRERIDLRGIRGCNLALWRADLVRVNGYNEAFAGWGREDSELAVRLMNSGVRRMDLRGRAVCFHLWHPPASRAGLSANDELLEKARTEEATRCQQGLDQYLTLPPT